MYLITYLLCPLAHLPSVNLALSWSALHKSVVSNSPWKLCACVESCDCTYSAVFGGLCCRRSGHKSETASQSLWTNKTAEWIHGQSHSVRPKDRKWYRKPISELQSVICHVGSQSHSVTCHPTQVNTPRLNPSQTDRLGGMEGWVDRGVGYIPRWCTCPQAATHPGVRPMTSWS